MLLMLLLLVIINRVSSQAEWVPAPVNDRLTTEEYNQRTSKETGSGESVWSVWALLDHLSSNKATPSYGNDGPFQREKKREKWKEGKRESERVDCLRCVQRTLTLAQTLCSDDHRADIQQQKTALKLLQNLVCIFSPKEKEQNNLAMHC